MKKMACILLFMGVVAALTAQQTGIKTNTVFLVTASPNMGIEFGLGEKFSLSIEGGYNPFQLKPELFWKHWFVQPELRRWYCHRYAGSFWGIHTFYAGYNVDVPKITRSRFEGSLYGAGVSYGYSWMLNNKWNLEATIGAGYARMLYDKYECGDCGEKLGSYSRNYYGPSKAAVSLIYFIH
ncbi:MULTISPECIES: DUF3575 domain-containing protein [Proteiniphilum]|jgi:hypothetical protein|uniref:DUF3575 domain-containing protein n=1 Tax=Proteiniphilum TaxID=294702 RepID=UPI001EEC94C9|nr:MULTISPECIES: DUF3575 domain-containing protein [Proteiniphilum]ULB34000.1 DUF3575 domain-containing protein [Proteiniphilum propionicum]